MVPFPTATLTSMFKSILKSMPLNHQCHQDGALRQAVTLPKALDDDNSAIHYSQCNKRCLKGY